VKCLLKYQWVKLPRNLLPPGKGIMGAWARLASRAAFRNGSALYCGYLNDVTVGSWAGGIVGVKSILGTKNRQCALDLMDALSDLGFIDYELQPKTKKLIYHIKDWVVNCSGAPCMGREAVYATDGYGFLCMPRNITERLAAAHYTFSEADAWLDLWCHTVWQDPNNAFSYMAPAVQYGRHGAIQTLESLGHRWRWEKTKVWRFFKKHADAFPLYKLPGAFGCLILNSAYPTKQQFSLPETAQIMRIVAEMCAVGKNAHFTVGSDHQRLNRIIAAYSFRLTAELEKTSVPAVEKNRVALSDYYNIRAYFSPCWHCKDFIKDCQSICSNTQINRVEPRAGPPPDYGGIEYGKYEGIPLW